MDRYMNLVLNDVTVTQHSVVNPETGSKFVLRLNQVFLRGYSVNSIKLPDDMINLFKTYNNHGRKQSDSEKIQEDLDYNKQNQQEQDNSDNIQIKRPTKSYGRGQQRNMLDQISQQIEEEDVDNQSNSQHSSSQLSHQLEDNYLDLKPKGRGRGRGRVYGQGSKDKKVVQNPSLSQEDQEDILNQLLIASGMIRQTQNKIDAQTMRIQQKRGGVQSNKSFLSKSSNKKLKQLQQENNNLNSRDQEQRENIVNNNNQTGIKKQIGVNQQHDMFNDAQTLMNISTQEFLENIDINQGKICSSSNQ